MVVFLSGADLVWWLGSQLLIFCLFPDPSQEPDLSSAHRAESEGMSMPHYKSQNHRMFGVGRDLCGSSSATPCQSRVTYSRLHGTLSRWVLNISRGESTASLGNLFQCSIKDRHKDPCCSIVASPCRKAGLIRLRSALIWLCCFQAQSSHCTMVLLSVSQPCQDYLRVTSFPSWPINTACCCTREDWICLDQIQGSAASAHSLSTDLLHETQAQTTAGRIPVPTFPMWCPANEATGMLQERMRWGNSATLISVSQLRDARMKSTGSVTWQFF